jgi:hypothetical protein
MPHLKCVALLSAVALLAGGGACGFEGQAQDELDLSAAVDSLADRLDALEAQFPVSAELTPGSGTYATIVTDVGALTFSVDRVEASDAGLKALLTIGNTTAATIEEVGATLTWGPSPGSRAGSRQATLAKTLRPGAWTVVTVQLDTVASSGLGYLRIAEVTHTGIVLR